MLKLKDIYNYSLGFDKDVGLELEVEFKRRPSDAFIHNDWMAVNDGSLRNIGMEFITQTTVKVDDALKDSLKALTDWCTKHKADPDCFRTSFHVHYNVKDKTPVQVCNIALAYWLLEPLLLKFCGPSREKHHYCLGLSVCEGTLRFLEADIRSGCPIQNFSADNGKYASLNFTPIQTQGSIEFRGMRGSLQHEDLFTWVRLLKSIVDASYGAINPAFLMDELYQLTPDKLLKYFFDDEQQAILKKLPEWEKLVKVNEDILATFAYGNDWTDYEEAIEDRYGKAKPRRKTPSIADMQREFNIARPRVLPGGGI